MTLFCLSLFLNSQDVLSQCYGTLIWNDEFDGPNLDLTKWNYDTGNGCPSLCGWGNNELEYYTNLSKNIYISGGILHLEAIKETYMGSEFTSGKINTRTKFENTYGRYEARIRLPQGDGLWPAFWMLRHDNNWPMTGEIDIMEYRGDFTNRTSGTLHYGSPWPANQYDGNDYFHSTDLYTNFHTYAVEWSPNSIKWYFDDIVIKNETRTPNTLNPGSTNDPWPWEEDFWIILNVAVGGWFTGVTDPNLVVLTKPDMEIDYVRVYDMTPLATDQTPYNGVIPIPGRVEAEEYDIGCPGIAYNDSEEFNQGNQFRYDEVDIEVTTDVGGGYNTGWTATGEWLEYTVDVAANGTYDIDIRVASDGGGGQLRLEMDGVDITGTVNLPNTFGWQNWQTVSLTNIPMSVGQQVLRVYAENTGFNFNYINFSTNILPVDLLNFTGTDQGNYNVLNWSTAEEKNNSHFEIQYSYDGINFYILDTVNSKGSNSSYTFIHNAPYSKSTYYRLSQFDYNGTTSYSPIILIHQSGTERILIPNPAENDVYFKTNHGEFGEIKIYDITGQLRITQAIKNVYTQLNISTLESAIYILKFESISGKTEQFKLIKK